MYLTPMETTEIIIDEVDIAGGNDSNFIFEWEISKIAQKLYLKEL